MEVGDILYLAAIYAGEALTEGACFPIRPVDWGVERDLGGGHLLGGTNRVGRLLEQSTDLVIGRIALQDL